MHLIGSCHQLGYKEHLEKEPDHMQFLTLLSLAAVLASGPPAEARKSVDRFYPEKALLGEQNTFNLTVFEACKHQENYNITFFFSNNTGDVGSMYPIETKGYTVNGIKNINETEYKLIIPSQDNKTIKAEKFVGLQYLVKVKAHADIGFNFYYFAPKDKASVNFTIISKCENEKKEETLYSIDKDYPAPTLIASSTMTSTTMALFVGLFAVALNLTA